MMITIILFTEFCISTLIVLASLIMNSHSSVMSSVDTVFKPAFNSQLTNYNELCFIPRFL